MSLKSLAIEYSNGEKTLEEIKEELKEVIPAIYHSDVDGGWFEGNPDNTLSSVFSLIGTKMTKTQYDEFCSAL